MVWGPHMGVDVIMLGESSCNYTVVLNSQPYYIIYGMVVSVWLD